MKTAEIRPNVQMTHIKQKQCGSSYKANAQTKDIHWKQKHYFFTGSLNSLNLTDLGLFWKH